VLQLLKQRPPFPRQASAQCSWHEACAKVEPETVAKQINAAPTITVNVILEVFMTSFLRVDVGCQTARQSASESCNLQMLNVRPKKKPVFQKRACR